MGKRIFKGPERAGRILRGYRHKLVTGQVRTVFAILGFWPDSAGPAERVSDSSPAAESPLGFSLRGRRQISIDLKEHGMDYNDFSNFGKDLEPLRDLIPSVTCRRSSETDSLPSSGTIRTIWRSGNTPSLGMMRHKRIPRNSSGKSVWISSTYWSSMESSLWMW